MIQARVWCIWIGGYEMSEPRKRCLDMIKQNVGVPVTLVTDENLHQYILKEHPLHEGYVYLSGMLKCDYIRAYLMCHYGGGYTDIKQTDNSWEPHFHELESNSDMWVCGYKEHDVGGVALVEDTDLFEQLKANWQILVGNCAFICKPHTPFTDEWLQQVHAKMDVLLPKIKEHPAKHQRDAFHHWINGAYSTFPVRWAELMGWIFHPLCLKYSGHILQTLPSPKFNDYM